MEPVEAEMNLPRQPLPVTVKIDGDEIDIAYWSTYLMKKAEFRGDQVHRLSQSEFKIYPRAVND